MTTTKDWTDFFNDLDADDGNKVSIALMGSYYGTHIDDDFLERALDSTGVLDDVHRLLTDREVIRNNNLCLEGETYLDLYGDGVALIGGFYFEWDVFKTLLNLEEELSTSVITAPLEKLLDGKEMNGENVNAALREDRGRTMSNAIVDYFDTLIDTKPSAIYDAFEKSTEMTDHKRGEITLSTLVTTTVGELKATLEDTTDGHIGRTWFEKQDVEITLNNGEIYEASLVHPRDKKILDDDNQSKNK